MQVGVSLVYFYQNHSFETPYVHFCLKASDGFPLLLGIKTRVLNKNWYYLAICFASLCLSFFICKNVGFKLGNSLKNTCQNTLHSVSTQDLLAFVILSSPDHFTFKSPACHTFFCPWAFAHTIVSV